MKEARGQNKLFQNASPLMCCFAIGHFLILKNQYERQAIEFLFKVQISLIALRVTQISVVFYVHTPLCELCNALNGISHKKLFAVFFFKQMGIFIRLSHHIFRAEVPTNR